MKRYLTVPTLLIGITLLLTQSAWAQNFNFNDGTLQGWTMRGAYDENGNGPYTHDFIPGWTSEVNYPTPDPGSGVGALQLYADGGHGISGSSGASWVIELHSPDLSTNPDWQNSRGYSVRIVENMGIRHPVYANLWVTVRDMNAGTDWTLWRGSDVELNHSNTYDRDALWNTIEFDLSNLATAFPDYMIKEIHLTLRGSMLGLFDGPVAIDEITSLGPSTAPRIHVDVPNGGEVWDAGTTRLIRWNTMNYAGDVKISLVHGGVPHVITAGTANDGTFEWTLPTQVTLPITDAKIKIEDASDGDPVDTSNEPFSIVAPASSITVDVPNGGEVWDAGSTRYIRWHGQGFDGTVSIEYSLDNGATYQGIVSAAENSGTYTWIVPNASSTNALVRISDSATGDVSDTSNATFTITPLTPTLTVDAPNGGEIWDAGSLRSIRWHTTDYLGQIGIEYSTDGGSTYTVVAAVTVDDGTFAWTVPETPTEQGLVRIFNPENPTTRDVSDAYFAITSASLTVVAPNGGEEWQAGTSQPIEWTSEYFENPVRIEYSTDSGLTFVEIANATPNTGSYTWLVPDTPTTEALVRISDATDWLPADTSDAVFTISPQSEPALTVANPNGGESWEVGSSQSIRWSSVDFDGPIHIEYSTDDGLTYADVVATTPNSGAYTWLVPDTPTYVALVRISDAADGDPSDVSDDVFTIVAVAQPSITVASPNGGESWEAGSSQTITWLTQDFDGQVRLQYSTDGGTTYTDIAASIVNSGSHPWEVPDTPTVDALVRISDAADGDPSDTSDDVFTILSLVPQSITITSPNGGESWQEGSIQSIQWGSESFDGPVEIEYSTDAGATYRNVIATTPNTGSYGWLVPGTPTSEGVVRISDVADGEPFDISDAVFTIVSLPQQSVAIAAPNGGENWEVGSTQSIMWQSDGLTGRVRIEYSTDEGANYVEIAAGAEDTGSYAWVVPDTPTAEGLVRIADAADGDPFDVSDGVFAIVAAAQPSITIVSPNGGEIWARGSRKSIRWTSEDFDSLVDIESSDDGGQTYALIAGGVANTGAYQWAVTGTPSNRCRVRISDAADGDPSDVSDDDFTVVSGVGDVTETPIPTEFALYQNYPNPFRSATTIRYAIPVATTIDLAIFDIVGREVRVLSTGDKAPGEYEVSFVTRSLPPGLYVCRLRAGNVVETQSLMVLR